MPDLAGIQLRNNIWTIQGPPDSGKSNLAKFMLTLDAYKSHLVYDPYWGFDPKVHNVLRPTTDVAARAALWAYANATDDDELAADIREWVGGIAANGGDETDA